MGFKTIDIKKIVELRKLRKSALAYADNSITKDVLRFQTMVREFVSAIPHRTNDFFQWNVYSSTGFEVRYVELMNDYKAIENYADQLLTIDLKKETEIKEIESTVIKELNHEMKIKPVKRGGKREGSGRKSMGIKKPVSITLPSEMWVEIDNLIQAGEYKSYADYFRSMISVDK